MGGTVKKIRFTLICLTLFLINSIIYAQSTGIKTKSASKTKAIIASAIIPGWGQSILKNKQKGEVMLWADGAIWLLYGGFQWYGHSRNHDAKLFAKVNADANINIKSDKYYRALELYSSSDAYNDDIRREAREKYPDDPQAQLDYLYQNGYFGDSSWNWKSDSLRYAYWQRRKSAREALTRAGFMFGCALLNRAISVIDCAFFTQDKRYSFSFAPPQDQNGIGIVFRF